MGKRVNATKSVSCQPRSGVTLALGQSKIYKPERDLSGVQSLHSLSLVLRQVNVGTTWCVPRAWYPWCTYVTVFTAVRLEVVPGARERARPRAEDHPSVHTSLSVHICKTDTMHVRPLSRGFVRIQ